jgi:voltage-gated sodium channel
MSASRSEAIDERLQQIEQSRLFQGSVIFIILLSALTVGAKTYELPPIVEAALPVFDLSITLFFLVEILFRFAAAPRKSRFLANGWNLFDTIIVVGSLLPLENAETVLVARLLRVFRVLRLVSVVPQLRFLINALLKAIPRMGYIALLMFIIFYIYGAIGSLFFSKVNPVLWGDISIAMLTLFRVATFEDWTDVMYETMAVHPVSWIYYLTFIFLTAFVFLNMMVGTILEVMTEEQDAASRKAAHDERARMGEQLERIERQLAVLTERLDDGRESPRGDGR